jgi:nucleoredoxin
VALQAAAVVGIYISAGWCAPCQAFTPRLVQVRDAVRAAGKGFEVVFLSGDVDKPRFEAYFRHM